MATKKTTKKTKIENQEDFVRAIQALNGALTFAHIGGHCHEDAEAKLDDGVEVLFYSVDDLDRFLRIVTHFQPWRNPLYKRVVPRDEDVKGAWEYALWPINDCEPEGCPPGHPDNVDFTYQVWVRFPTSDLPGVLDHLREHNSSARTRRGSVVDDGKSGESVGNGSVPGQAAEAGSTSPAVPPAESEVAVSTPPPQVPAEVPPA